MNNDDDRNKLLGGFGNTGKVNSSDKTGILPGATSHTGYGDEPKAKKTKYWIIGGVVVLVIALILGLTLGKKSGDDPSPGPGPTPGPPDVYNPYSVDKDSIVTQVQKQSGLIKMSQSKLEMLNKQVEMVGDADVISASPKDVPTGPNN
jgi:hypothetical protein